MRNSKIIFRILCIITISVIASSCTSYTKLQKPTIIFPYQKTCQDYVVNITPKTTDGIITTNLSGVMFEVDRYTTWNYLELNPNLSLRGRSSAKNWLNNYVYERDNYSLDVFTSKDYYGGTIGILVDNKGRYATNQPFVSVSGNKKGRDWGMPAEYSKNKGIFYFIKNIKKNNMKWKIRYSGEYKDYLTLQVIPIDKKAAESNVISDLKVSLDQFYKGFNIKNIYVKGISINSNGSITYKITDQETRNSCELIYG